MDGRRASIKAASGKWRDKLRQDCKHVAQQKRQETLDRYRASLSPGQLQNIVNQSVRQAVIAEIEKQKSSQDFLEAGASGDITDADIDSFLLDIEEQLCREIADELDRIEAEQEAAIHHMVAQHEAGSGVTSQDNDNQVLCPVCHQAYLLWRHGVVACPKDKFQINLQAENVTPAYLRSVLASTYEEHAASGCSGKLDFQVEDMFGSTSLTASCATCQLYDVLV
eukprot:jgi/Chrzof1/7241/Cz02g16060.t1